MDARGLDSAAEPHHHSGAAAVTTGPRDQPSVVERAGGNSPGCPGSTSRARCYTCTGRSPIDTRGGTERSNSDASAAAGRDPAGDGRSRRHA